MTTIAIVYHSGYGHTAVLAQSVAEGVKRAGAKVNLVRLESAEQDFGPALEAVTAADGVIFGAPTYMGDISVPLRAFFVASSKVWGAGAWKDKLAAGFTNGATFGGNKDHSIASMWVLAMQQGMIWAGPGVPNAQINRNTDAGASVPNRIGSALGVITQSDNAAPDVTPPPGDLEFGALLGERVAKIAAKLKA